MARQRKTASASTTTAASSVVTSHLSSRASLPRPPKQAFHFFGLPSELRLRIYEELLCMGEPIDLDARNHRRVLPRLALFLVCHRMHEEAYRVFYAQTIRLFPSPAMGKFFNTKYPLLERLPVRYRMAINNIELRLGPGWTRPPRCQHTKPQLGLTDCMSLRLLKIFVELDPSDSVFVGFRGPGATEETYKWFCVDLVTGILDQVPSIEAIEIDAYPSVKKNTPLVSALCRTIQERGKRLTWGPLRGWEKEDDGPGLIGLESALSSMSLGAGDVTRVITTPLPEIRPGLITVP